MSHSILLQLTGILVLGILAQWMAWRLRLPSILLLLVAGILAGPLTGWLKPDELFGHLMLPLVSLSVAVILYEGGLNLKIRELQEIGKVFLLLTSVAVAISWMIGTIAARYLLGFQWEVATLMGAILVVTGPTVIGPILKHLRLRGRVGALLKWEGIIIDPLGATLALMVATVVRAEVIHDGFNEAFLSLSLTLVIGILAGCLAAGLLIVALARFWVPDALHNPVSLMLMFSAFTTANLLQEESGLLAVTVMGILLANQKRVSIRHVVEFKETLTVLLISCLFIILAARLKPEDLKGLHWGSFAFVAIIILIGRPLSILLSTWKSPLTWQERCFLSCMAPRGIVAAAISSVFALSLVEAGYPQAIEMVPVMFLVIFLTVLLYGLSASPLARRLGLIHANPQGILFVGAERWVRALAKALHEEKCLVLLIDTNWDNLRQCRMDALPCIYGSALSEVASEQNNYAGLGKMFALTSNNEVNSLACMHYSEGFGKQNVYQLPFSTSKEGRHEVVSQEHRGRFLFGSEWTFSTLSDWAGTTSRIKKTRLTPEFDYKAFQAEQSQDLLPLFLLKPDGTLLVRMANELQSPKPGDLIFSLVRSSSSSSSS